MSCFASRVCECPVWQVELIRGVKEGLGIGMVQNEASVETGEYITES